MPAVTVRSSPNGFDRDDRVADLDRVGVGERERRQGLGVDVDLEQREVRGRVGTDDRGLDRVLVREADLDLGGAVDDMEVRDDVAFLVDHEPRAERLRWPGTELPKTSVPAAPGEVEVIWTTPGPLRR